MLILPGKLYLIIEGVMLLIFIPILVANLSAFGFGIKLDCPVMAYGLRKLEVGKLAFLALDYEPSLLLCNCLRPYY